MPKHWLIGLGAGLISAVVFVSASTGPLAMRYFLFALTPLAIALAGLGWGWRSGLIAGIVGTGLIAALTGHATLITMFAVTQAVPMVILVYLAGLSRTDPGSEGTSTAAPQEWYPPGRLMIWAAALSAITALIILLVLGAMQDDFAIILQSKFAEAIKSGMLPLAGKGPLSDEDIAILTNVAVTLLPAGAAISTMASLLFSLWLSGRITLASGQLERPWPDLAAMTFPSGTATLLALAVLACFLPDPFGMAGSTLLGALLFAYLLLGLAVIHYTTRGNPWRFFALWALYVALLFAYGVVLIVTLLGISETFLHLRTKLGGPPTSSPPSNGS